MISTVSTPEERAAVYAYRYDVIVREQGISADPSADHASGTIIDPADQAGTVFVARNNNSLAGTVRLNLLRDGSAAPYCTLLGLNTLPTHVRQLSSLTSRLVVGTNWRNSPVAIRLAQACYRRARTLGVAWDYIVVRPQLAQFFLRLGYVRAGSDVEFPGVGPVAPLRLDLDPAYLRRVRSVLVAGWA